MTVIMKMLELCTNHVTAYTASGLDADGCPGVISYNKADYGWFIYVPESEPEEGDPTPPEDIQACLNYARGQGCGWIMFDRDAEPIPELKTFNW